MPGVAVGVAVLTGRGVLVIVGGRCVAVGGINVVAGAVVGITAGAAQAASSPHSSSAPAMSTFMRFLLLNVAG